MINSRISHLFIAAALALSIFFPAAPAVAADDALSRDNIPTQSQPVNPTEGPRKAPLSSTTTITSPEPAKHTIPADTSINSPGASSLATYAHELLPDLENGSKRIFSRDNAPLALAGFGLAGLAFTADHNARDYFLEQKPLQHSANTGDKIGQGYYHVAVGLAFLGVGELTDNRKTADTGAVALEALFVNGVATESLKFAVSRKRPNSGNHMSFPSGHASSTATLAASISEMYDWNPWVAVPLYATTTFVAAARIQADEHYLSDVLAGMTLGTLVGTSFAKYHKEHNATSGPKITILPWIDRDTRGIVCMMKF